MSSKPFPLNIGNLMSTPAIIFAIGTVEIKVCLVGLYFLLFTALVVLIFIELLGDRSLDLTSTEVFDVVGEL